MSKWKFEWDDAKAPSNLRKHGVSFEEAKTVFDDPDVLIRPDIEHSTDEEDRAQALGLSIRHRVLFVVFIDPRAEVIRIISARRATKQEAAAYAKRKKQRSKG